MGRWLERYRTEAEHILHSGYVRDIDFSGATYQVEVFDAEFGESRWPFLQFDEKSKLKDAFCSCSSDHGKCVHLAAAYLAIMGTTGEALHLRFERSLWNQICRLLGEYSGYEERFLQKKNSDHYFFQNEVFFEIVATTEYSKHILKQLVEQRLRETPENSIKFSNLSQEEIGRWREGRPGRYLRYALSFWADLAKWMMQQTDQAKVLFEEDQEGFPTILHLQFPLFVVRVEIKKRDLVKLIPSLETVYSSLKVFHLIEQKVKDIVFDPHTISFHIDHSTVDSSKNNDQKVRFLDEWAYVPQVGFYFKDGHSLLSQSYIPKEEVPFFLEHFHTQIAHYIPIHERRLSLCYSMHFDADWNWYFTAYLFKPGDLHDSRAILIGNWMYIEDKGFYRIEDALFDRLEVILPLNAVSRFINHHRIWLNGQEGFQTHLASIESQLTYSVTDSYNLCFYVKTNTKSVEMMDFGEWIYYAGIGFFSKKHMRLGHAVRSGVEISSADVAQFIQKNHEELETIPRFFTTTCPLVSRSLDITVQSQNVIQVKPLYTLKPEYHESQIYLFGDFVYLKGEGFHELPAHMRLPEKYTKPVNFFPSNFSHFFEHELPYLMKFSHRLDPALLTPHKFDLVINALVRTNSKGLKAELFYQTEYGKVAITALLRAIENKRRYYLTDAGLIDLHSEKLHWLKNFKVPYDCDTQSLELSSLDLIRLDATWGLLGPTQDTPSDCVTRNLLKELREFTSHDAPDLKGLTSHLRLYQQTGLHWLWFLYKNGLSGLLCDDMGLGKTHQAMALIAATLNHKSAGTRLYLVVCPTSVIYHWQDKLENFLPHIKVHTFHGLKRSLDNMPREGLILTSYGIVRMEKKRLEEIPFEIAIFDEIQVAKNPRSRVHEALKTLKSRMRLGLTGTPIENNLKELKSLFDIVLPGYMPTEARFKEIFVNPIEKGTNEEKKALLAHLIRPFILRRRKTEVLQELPAKSEDRSYCDLTEEQVKLYTDILAQTQDTLIKDLHTKSTAVNYVHVFSLLSQLKQVCNHPALIYKDPKNYKAYTSGKWELFIELLDEARESRQKVVVFSQYLYMLDIIENYLLERGWEYAQIRGDTLNRREELKRFQEDPNCVVFIGSLQAAGLGIDLTAASVVIMYDRWWNAARENQAIDRVHRMGQKWGVQVYKLITKNTIEEKIDRMVTRKGQLLEDVVVADDQSLLKNFTRAEIIELFSFQETIV